MCGIVGFFGGADINGEEEQKLLLKRMADTIVHRGPDSGGYWCDVNHYIGFGHRRLSIVDLSMNGHQPMRSRSSRYVISYNGEVYNFKQLRSQLEKVGVKGDLGESDTCVVLDCIEHWGLYDALEKFNGMFAFALWDRKEKALYLARDRFGEKPLYYGVQNGIFMFASELKALKIHPQFEGEIDRDVLSLYLKYSYIPSPYSIYSGIKKLVPGNVLKVINGIPQKASQFWSLANTISQAKKKPFTGSYDDAVTGLNELLLSGMSERLTADVPIGAMLSGGVDSSLITAIMSQVSGGPVNTFTVSIDSPGFNEAEYAKEIAKCLGTNHTELHFNDIALLDVISKLSHIYDEPFADSSQIPTYLVSSLIKEYVTVAVSGDAGDEVFGGYTRYFQNARLWKNLNYLPLSIRKVVKEILLYMPPHLIDSFLRPIKFILPGDLAVGNIGSRLHKLANILDCHSTDDLYDRLISNTIPPQQLLKDVVHEWPELENDNINLDTVEKMMYKDSLGYLPGDILTKVDRASMANSLEVRVPFLDKNIVEYAWSLPLEMKVVNGGGKRILKDLLYRYVPQKLVDRPKQGFGIPLDELLRGALKDWAEDLLSASRLISDGYFEVDAVREIWGEHLRNVRNHCHQLWAILMFNQWLEDQRV